MTVKIEVDLDVDIDGKIKDIKRKLNSLDEEIDVDIEDFDLDIPEEETINVHVNDDDKHKLSAPNQDVYFRVDATEVKKYIRKLRGKSIDKEINLKANESVFTGSLGPITKKLNSFEEDLSLDIDINSLHFQRQLQVIGGQIRSWKEGLDGITLDVKSDIDGKSLQEVLGIEDAQKSNDLMLETLTEIKQEIGKKQPRRITNSSDFGSVRERKAGDQDDRRRFSLFDDGSQISITDLIDEDGLRNMGFSDMPAVTTQNALEERMRKRNAGPTARSLSGNGRFSALRLPDSLPDSRKKQAPLKTFKNAIGKVQPTFAGIYAVLSALLPVIAGLAVQAVGLAAAFGALGGAAAALGGLGLLGGESDSLAGSVANAEEKLNSFKSDLFQIFEPVADAFADDSAAIMDAFLNSIGRVTDEARGLQQFTSIVTSLFPYMAEALEGSLAVVNKHSDAIGRLAEAAGQLIAGGLPKFLDALLNEGLSSVDQFSDVVKLLASMGYVALTVVDNLMNFLQMLSGIGRGLRAVGALLSNEAIQKLLIMAFTALSVIGVLSFLSSALTMVAGTLGTLVVAFKAGSGWATIFSSTLLGTVVSAIATSIKAIGALTIQLLTLEGVLARIAGLMIVVTGGLALLGAAGALLSVGSGAIDAFNSTGSPPDGRGGGLGGGGGDTNITVEGDMDNQSLQSIRDITEEQNSKRSSQGGMGF
jgi:hypothetical protein